MQTIHLRQRSDEDGGAVDLLLLQHREIDQLLVALVRARALRDKERLLAEGGDLLAVHMAVEERVFYPGLCTSTGGNEQQPFAVLAVEDHFELKGLIVDLLEADLSLPSFNVSELNASVEYLRERFGAHARAEERLFPNLRHRFSRVRMRRLAYEMRVLEFQLRTDAAPRDLILTPSARTAHA